MLYIDWVTWEPENDLGMKNDLEKWGHSNVMKMIAGWICASWYGYILVQDVENIETHAGASISWRPLCVRQFPRKGIKLSYVS